MTGFSLKMSTCLRCAKCYEIPMSGDAMAHNAGIESRKACVPRRAEGRWWPLLRHSGFELLRAHHDRRCTRLWQRDLHHRPRRPLLVRPAVGRRKDGPVGVDASAILHPRGRPGAEDLTDLSPLHTRSGCALSMAFEISMPGHAVAHGEADRSAVG